MGRRRDHERYYAYEMRRILEKYGLERLIYRPSKTFI